MKDLTNQRFGRLTAMEPVRRERGKGIVWRCDCSCGGEKEVRAAYLLNGHTRSCGCLYRETRKDCYKQRRDLREHTSVSALVASKKPGKNNTSGYTGVCMVKGTGKWQAYINFQKRRIHLGCYEDIETAASVRAYAEKYIHDPIILQYFEGMNAKKREQFYEYLRNHNADEEIKEVGEKI